MTDNSIQTNRYTYKEILARYKEGDRFTAWVDHYYISGGDRMKLDFVRQSNTIVADQEDITGKDHWTNYNGIFEVVAENIPDLLTHDEVMDRMPYGTTFQAWVTSNPFGGGGRSLVNFIRLESLDSIMDGNYDTADKDYAWKRAWGTQYKGRFEIVPEPVVKAEPREVPIMEIKFSEGPYNLTATYEVGGEETRITMEGLHETFWFCRSKGSTATAMVRLMKQAVDFIPDVEKLLKKD